MIVSAGGIAPLVAMLHAEDGTGDEDQTLDMKEQATKTIRDLCFGDCGNQRPIAEKGGVPPLLNILSETSHPWSIREAAAEALALLAKESAGGPAQEAITAENGVVRMIAVHREVECTAECKLPISHCLRNIAVFGPAKQQMLQMGVLQPRETRAAFRDPNADPMALNL